MLAFSTSVRSLISIVLPLSFAAVNRSRSYEPANRPANLLETA